MQFSLLAFHLCLVCTEECVRLRNLVQMTMSCHTHANKTQNTHTCRPARTSTQSLQGIL